MMQTRIDALKKIYQAFALATASHRSGTACETGCAFCCTDAGRIDCTTLEGLRIRGRIRKMPRPRQLDLKKALKRDMQKRESGLPSPCPFLMKNNACMIYPVRPFACRRITSLHRCAHDHPPLISRQVMAIAEKAIADLQRLDDNGYSGHLSFILHMLDTPRFLATYQAGDFKPEEIMAFGKAHRIVINRMVVTPSASPPT